MSDRFRVSDTLAKGVLVAALFLVFCAVAVTPAQAEGRGDYYSIGSPSLTDIWVDPVHGSDTNSGAVRAEALRTLTGAWDRIPGDSRLASGYRIWLVGGTYSEDMLPTGGWMESRHGTLQCPIIIEAADGPGTAVMPRMDVCNVSYLYLIGLHLRYGAENVLHLASCDHVLVRQCRIEGTGDLGTCDCPQEAFKANQCQYLYVEGSDISGGWDAALDFFAVQYGHIYDSSVHHAADWLLYLKGGSAYYTIDGNEIYDGSAAGFSAGQGSNFYYMVSPWLHYEVENIRFTDNVIHDVDGTGMCVYGGYDVLLADNTLYRVGKVSQSIEIMQGSRNFATGEPERCLQYLKEGGWGTDVPGAELRIPNRNVYVYDNIVYNPAGYQSQWCQFSFGAPVDTPSGTNVPSPARSDDNVQIAGNVIWNGPADLPLTGEYVPDTPTCNETQLRSDNAINTIMPRLIDPGHGDFRPAQGSDALAAMARAIPDFPGDDRPRPPLAPAGGLSNVIRYDRGGSPRTGASLPGAYASPDSPLAQATAIPSTAGEGTPTQSMPASRGGSRTSTPAIDSLYAAFILAAVAAVAGIRLRK